MKVGILIIQSAGEKKGIMMQTFLRKPTHIFQSLCRPKDTFFKVIAFSSIASEPRAVYE
jgi:hypothetical protein